MMYHKYNSDDISYNAMIYHSPVLGTRATRIFLGLLNSLGLSSGLSANGLENLGGDVVLDVSAGGLLVAGDVPADDDGLGGAVGLGVAPLADGDGLGDDLADGDHVVDEGGGVGEPVSKKE